MSTELYAISEEKAVEFYQGVNELSRILAQMGTVMMGMQKRLDDLEASQRTATVSHAEAKRLGTLIRMRAREYGEKYGLTEPKDQQKIRGAIKKAVMTRYDIKDLHDCPQIALRAAEAQIERWADIRTVMKIREKHREDGS